MIRLRRDSEGPANRFFDPNVRGGVVRRESVGVEFGAEGGHFSLDVGQYLGVVNIAQRTSDEFGNLGHFPKVPAIFSLFISTWPTCQGLVRVWLGVMV